MKPFYILISFVSFSIINTPFASSSWKNNSRSAAEMKVLETNLKNHVVMLSETIGDRSMVQINNLNKAKEYIINMFKDYGYEVTLQDYRIEGQTASNVIAEKKGLKSPSEIVIIGAHYDTYCNPGADDNASGVAGLLELARLMKDTPPDRTVRFVAFVNEEPPYFKKDLMGSRVYTREAKRKGENIVGAIILESIGYYVDRHGTQKYPLPIFSLFYSNRGNFIGVLSNLKNNKLRKKVVSSFKRHSKFPLQSAAVFDWITGVDFSDHWSFWQEGYPAVMVSDSAFMRNPYYHDDLDTWDKLNYNSMAQVIDGLYFVVKDLSTGAFKWKTQ